MNKPVLLGVLGGLGPMSTFRFCQLVTAHTKATCDNDHIDMLISSRATTPDRTAFILRKSLRDPLPVMIEEAHRLQAAGVSLLVIPCNTAHYFYRGLQDAVSVPMLNIMEESVAYFQSAGVQKFGLLATEGTVSSGAYHAVAEKAGIACITPEREGQELVSRIIYDDIKQNKPVEVTALDSVIADLQKRGAERILLGCTELSMIKDQFADPALFVDSLEILAESTIHACGKIAVGFSHMKAGE